MILLDTNVLVALVDDRDELNKSAVNDLGRISKRKLHLTAPVLSETCYTLWHSSQRNRLRQIIQAFDITPLIVEDETAHWHDVFRWLERYAEHKPDWCDAHLVILTALFRKAKVWTYDSEFSTIWRRLDGSAVPLAVRRR